MSVPLPTFLKVYQTEVVREGSQRGTRVTLVI